jgi:hypothetical protein
MIFDCDHRTACRFRVRPFDALVERVTQAASDARHARTTATDSDQE